MVWSLWFFALLGYYGLTTWLGALLQQAGFPVTKSVFYTLLISLAGIPGFLMAAWLVEAWGRKPTCILMLLGRETILRNGKQVGYLTSGGYGYTVGKPIGYGYIRDSNGVDDDYVRGGTYELVVANNLVKARAHLGPLYDPENLRVKG